jgi:hypothetical protein
MRYLAIAIILLCLTLVGCGTKTNRVIYGDTSLDGYDDTLEWTRLESTLEKKVDLLYSKLSEKERCRFEEENRIAPTDKNGYYVKFCQTYVPQIDCSTYNAWHERCDKYLERTPEAYKIP